MIFKTPLNIKIKNSIYTKVLASETMAVIARIRKARKQIRVRGGIPLIVSFFNSCSNSFFPSTVQNF